MNIIKMKKKAFNFFATVAVMKFVYVDDTMTPVDSEDMAYARTFELFLEYGNNHFAKTFDMIEEHLDKGRGTKEMLLNKISTRTKAAIVQSILGLGLIFRQQGHVE
eukprot:9291176-Heterocapsa_arctica.AAC.1